MIVEPCMSCGGNRRNPPPKQCLHVANHHHKAGTEWYWKEGRPGAQCIHTCKHCGQMLGSAGAAHWCLRERAIDASAH